MDTVCKIECTVEREEFNRTHILDRLIVTAEVVPVVVDTADDSPSWVQRDHWSELESRCAVVRKLHSLSRVCLQTCSNTFIDSC